MLSALRLQPLLRSVGLQLCSAGPVRLPALRTARGMFPTSRLLHDTCAEGANHAAVSAVGAEPTGATPQQRVNLSWLAPNRELAAPIELNPAAWTGSIIESALIATP